MMTAWPLRSFAPIGPKLSTGTECPGADDAIEFVAPGVEDYFFVCFLNSDGGALVVGDKFQLFQDALEKRFELQRGSDVA